MRERIKTGVPGLDDILNGGIPKGSFVLLSGVAGSGKTTLASQFLYEGLKNNERCVFISFEETPQLIKESMMDFGFDFGLYEKKGTMSFIKYDTYNTEGLFDVVESTIRNMKADRVVIDSISVIGLNMKNKAEFRRVILNLSNIMRKLGVTCIAISEIVPGKHLISRYGVEEFVSDGVIVLYYERKDNKFLRNIQVFKMRGDDHSKDLHRYDITPKGIVVSKT